MSYPNSPGPDHTLGISVKVLIRAFLTMTTLTGFCNKQNTTITKYSKQPYVV